MNNCHVGQCVGGVGVKWRGAKRKIVWRLDISHRGKVKEKKSALMSRNNQYALKVLCCQEVHTSSHKHIARLVFFQWISQVLWYKRPTRMYWSWQVVWQPFSNLFPWQAFISNTSCAVAAAGIACYTWENNLSGSRYWYKQSALAMEINHTL